MTRQRGRGVGIPLEALPTFVRVMAGVVVVSLALAACASGNSASSPASASTRPSTRAAPAEVVMVDVLATIPVGVYPVDVAVDPVGDAVYVTNRGDGTVSVIDTATREVVETITVGTDAVGLAVDPAAGLVYVAHRDVEGMGSVSVIDSGTRQVIDAISIGAGKAPGEVAVDPRTHSLFVVNGDATVSVVDTRTRRVVATLSMPGTSIAVAVDSAAGAAFVSSGGTVTVVDTRTRRITVTVEASGAAQLAVDSTLGRLLVANEADGTVSVMDTATLELMGTVTAGGPYGPFGLATDVTAGLAYVTGGSVSPDAAGEGGHWLVAVVDTDTLGIVETITWETSSLDPTLPAVVDPATDSVYLVGVDGIVTVIARR